MMTSFLVNLLCELRHIHMRTFLWFNKYQQIKYPLLFFFCFLLVYSFVVVLVMVADGDDDGAWKQLPNFISSWNDDDGLDAMRHRNTPCFSAFVFMELLWMNLNVMRTSFIVNQLQKKGVKNQAREKEKKGKLSEGERGRKLTACSRRFKLKLYNNFN